MKSLASSLEHPEKSLDVPKLSLEVPEYSLDVPEGPLDVPENSLGAPCVSKHVPDVLENLPEFHESPPIVVRAQKIDVIKSHSPSVANFGSTKTKPMTRPTPGGETHRSTK